MTSITSPAPALAATIVEVGNELAAAGFSPEEIAHIMAWKPFCSPEGCVCEKAADCYYCEACTGDDLAADLSYVKRLEEDMEREDMERKTLGALMYGEPTEDDYHEEW